MNTAQTGSNKLDDLRAKVDQFSADRDWGQFHTPKNLATALSVEAAELLEHFQWQKGDEPFAELPEPKRVAIAHEVADVLVYLLRFCSVTGIDPIQAAEEKLALNAEKYPVDKVRGQSAKYTEY
ncbi:MAG: nucleotide pyrophosphohydrolase [Mitsuaria chitosanitabida]|uniref:nucleotide pyrophosphohydrolase n=1 Tax=Roseateles chitosanitabidus TaxID=65048 RepID=UPI001B09F5A0|nr:nucleotide pyrophosphohydrolase [Roseateles chitosanitabidus]MBO9686106.1 nucleotide pyrophosphohydrolase [Roseateles chitosanitabidus]